MKGGVYRKRKLKIIKGKEKEKKEFVKKKGEKDGSAK